LRARTGNFMRKAGISSFSGFDIEINTNRGFSIQNEIGCRINGPGGADGHKHAGFFQVTRDPIQAIRHFAEENYIRSDRVARGAADRTDIIFLIKTEPWKGVFTLTAKRGLEISVQMED